MSALVGQQDAPLAGSSAPSIAAVTRIRPGVPGIAKACGVEEAATMSSLSGGCPSHNRSRTRRVASCARTAWKSRKAITPRAATATTAMVSGTGSGSARPSSLASAATEGARSISVAESRSSAQVEAAAVSTAATVRTRAASAGDTRLPTCGATAGSSSDRTIGT